MPSHLTCTYLPFTYIRILNVAAFIISPCVLNECRGRVVNTPTSYLGGSGFDSRSQRPAVVIEVFRGFPQSLKANVGIVP
jgi:hypothetical protein